MKYLEPKAPDNTKFYILDYTKALIGDSIASAVIIADNDSITIVRSGNLSTKVGVMLSGGVADTTASFTIVITSQAGQIINDTAQLYIVENEDDVDFDVVTKQQLVEFAFQDLRLSGFTFDHSADELSAMLSRLDGLMREYRLKGINTGYNHPKQIGLSELSDVAGIIDGLALSIGTLLAVAYMDGIGKTYTPNLLFKSNKAFNFVYAYCRSIPDRIFPYTTPRGAGGKMLSTLYPFFTFQSNNTVNNILNSNPQYITAGVWDQSVWDQANWG